MTSDQLQAFLHSHDGYGLPALVLLVSAIALVMPSLLVRFMTRGRR